MSCRVLKRIGAATHRCEHHVCSAEHSLIRQAENDRDSALKPVRYRVVFFCHPSHDIRYRRPQRTSTSTMTKPSLPVAPSARAISSCRVNNRNPLASTNGGRPRAIPPPIASGHRRHRRSIDCAPVHPNRSCVTDSKHSPADALMVGVASGRLGSARVGAGSPRVVVWGRRVSGAQCGAPRERL